MAVKQLCKARNAPAGRAQDNRGGAPRESRGRRVDTVRQSIDDTLAEDGIQEYVA